MKIDWDSEQSHLLLNPRLPEQEALLWGPLLELTKDYPSHIWLATSGSTQMKLVALHKKAILASAKAVNEHLEAVSADVWINPLPFFHVGGLGIWARASLNGAAVYPFLDKWSPLHFHQMIVEKKGTLTALVPAQVYDLVIHSLTAPQSLRAVIVGGGALQKSLYRKARTLGWPLLPSYGLTECASQVATATYQSLSEDGFPEMKLLPHVRVKTDANDCICISGPSLLSAYAIFEQGSLRFFNPVMERWLLTQDRGTLTGNSLRLMGRLGDFIKIGGESVEMGRLEKILEEIKLRQEISFDVVLAAVPDMRLGHVIHLFSTGKQVETLKKEYDHQVLPFERIRKVHFVDVIPRSSINKVLKN